MEKAHHAYLARLEQMLDMGFDYIEMSNSGMVTLANPALKLIRSESFTGHTSSEESSVRFDCRPVTIPREWADRFFFMRAMVEDDQGLIQQSVYWPKVLARFEDPAELTAHRQSRQNNIDVNNRNRVCMASSLCGSIAESI